MVKGFIFTVAGMLLSLAAMSQREITDLNGNWDIEESISAEKIPSKFNHQVQVPGLVNTANPGFNGVDKFYSKEYYSNSWAKPSLLNLTSMPIP